MKQSTKFLSKILIILGLTGILLGTVSGLHLFREYHRQPPINSIQTGSPTIRPWMTIPYISRLYDVPEPDLISLLNLKNIPSRHLSLSQIAKLTGKNQPDLVDLVINFINNLHPTPSFFK